MQQAAQFAFFLLSSGYFRFLCLEDYYCLHILLNELDGGGGRFF